MGNACCGEDRKSTATPHSSPFEQRATTITLPSPHHHPHPQTNLHHSQSDNHDQHTKTNESDMVHVSSPRVQDLELEFRQVRVDLQQQQQQHAQQQQQHQHQQLPFDDMNQPITMIPASPVTNRNKQLMPVHRDEPLRTISSKAESQPLHTNLESVLHPSSTQQPMALDDSSNPQSLQLPQPTNTTVSNSEGFEQVSNKSQEVESECDMPGLEYHTAPIIVTPVITPRASTIGNNNHLDVLKLQDMAPSPTPSSNGSSAMDAKSLPDLIIESPLLNAPFHPPLQPLIEHKQPDSFDETATPKLSIPPSIHSTEESIQEEPEIALHLASAPLVDLPLFSAAHSRHASTIKSFPDDPAGSEEPFPSAGLADEPLDDEPHDNNDAWKQSETYASTAKWLERQASKYRFQDFQRVDFETSSTVSNSRPVVEDDLNGVLVVQGEEIDEQQLLFWCRSMTRGYKHVDPPGILDFSNSWKNGMAFCALLHSHDPNLVDYNLCSPDKPKSNFERAFEASEKLFVHPLNLQYVLTVPKLHERVVMKYIAELKHAMLLSQK